LLMRDYLKDSFENPAFGGLAIYKKCKLAKAIKVKLCVLLRGLYKLGSHLVLVLKTSLNT